MNIFIIDCFDTWEYRVNLLYKVMTEAGNCVRVLLSDYRHIDKSRRLERKKDCKFFTAEPYGRNMSMARLRSHIQLSRDIFGFVEENIEDIDLLWVLAPPNSFVEDAAAVKQRYPGVSLVIDLIDLWPETIPVRIIKQFPPFYLWKRLRDKNLQYADFVVTECSLYRKVLRSVSGRIRSETLCLARQDKGYEPDLHLPAGKLSFCYLGSINHLIDIAVIRMIIAQCCIKRPVIFHIIGDGEKKNALIKEAKKAGAEVRYHGKVYERNMKQRIFDSCHYGLNIMKKSVCVGLTMKSIDYFEFGLPIINNIRGDTWSAVDKYRIGVNWKPVSAVEDIMKCDRKERQKAREFFEKFLTEQKFEQKVMHVLECVGE